VFECVPNVSEGRDRETVDALADACASCLLDVHTDVDHNRSVFTLAHDDASLLLDAITSLARAVAMHISLVAHEGVHPRFGALDVVPFVDLAYADRAAPKSDVFRVARSFARWWAETCDVPVFFYDALEHNGRDLPAARATAFATRGPDLGPTEPHACLGATAIGVRAPLVAVNCVLDTDDVALARRIATEIRARDGGLPGVRALGFALASTQCAQVSMNLTDLARTGIEAACMHVRDLARVAGREVTAVELVGLAPRAALAHCSEGFREWAQLDDAVTIEGRASARRIGDRS
jgi:glutamate formiminotransferase